MLFPGWCYQCRSQLLPHNHQGRSLICTPCLATLPYMGDQCCKKCGENHATGLCSEKWSGSLETYRSLFSYKNPVDGWINAFKYHDDLFAGRLLRQLLQKWMTDNHQWLSGFSRIVPTPLHPTNLQNRGFNQSEFFLSGLKSYPCDFNLLQKRQKTKTQVGLNREEREKNLQGAFRCKHPVEDESILIIDDVCTTGHTIFELANTLKSAGARSVSALTLCRNID